MTTHTAVEVNGIPQQEITVPDGKLPAEQWLFGPCPWSGVEEYGTRRMTPMEIGQHWMYCKDMEYRHNWTSLEIHNGKHVSYVLLDSHGTLYSILSF